MRNGNIGAYVLALLFIAVMVIGITNFMVEIPGNYGVNKSELDNASFVGKANEVKNMSDDMKNVIEESEITGIGEIDAPLMVLRGGYQAIMLSFSSIDLFVSMVSDLVTATGILPGWFQSFIIAAAAISVVLIVIGSLLRYDLITW